MYKFSILPYMNSAPLVHFLPQVCPGATFLYRAPRDSIAALTRGHVDAAIIPIVDYFDNPALEMVDGIGICADGNVESVILQCRKQLEDVRTVQLDPESKTSNRLLKLLAEEEILGTPDMILNRDTDNSDACVIIGDRALRADPSFETYDLAGHWKDMTGLPFVFAVWVYRAGHPDGPKLRRILHTAKRLGCTAVGKLARIYAQKLNFPEKRCCHYLTRCIHYDIGAGELAGMQQFRKCLQKSVSAFQVDQTAINL